MMLPMKRRRKKRTMMMMAMMSGPHRLVVRFRSLLRRYLRLQNPVEGVYPVPGIYACRVQDIQNPVCGVA